MNFDFSEEQLVLRDQARKFLSERAAPSRVRRVLETDAPYDTDLWRGMVEMAWPGTAIPERFGGAGYGYLELCVIAEELGRSLAPTPFSSSVYLATEAILLAGSAAQQTRWLPALASGRVIGCFALAEGPYPPRPETLQTRLADGRVNGVKVPVADGDVADVAVVVVRGAMGRRKAFGAPRSSRSGRQEQAWPPSPGLSSSAGGVNHPSCR
jgi:alkylation response protein AidB-like acyl-CoA dehydrogenase